MQGIKQLPPSRRDKKQIGAYLSPDLVEAVQQRRRANGVTAQEIIAEAVNKARAMYGRAPVLPIRRDRLVKREKRLAQLQTEESTVPSRAGKKRLAGWYEAAAVEQVAQFATEIGVQIQDLVEMGLRSIISEKDIDDARKKSNPTTINPPQVDTATAA